MDSMIEIYIWEFIANYLDAVEHQEAKHIRSRKRKIDWITKRSTNYKYNAYRTRYRKDMTEPHSRKQPKYQIKGLHNIDAYEVINYID